MSRRSRAACRSLLSATKRLISVRKSTLAFGRGTMTFIRPDNRSVLAYVRQYRDEVILCVANLSRAAQATELDLSPWKDRIPLEMLGRTGSAAIGELPYMITLAPYGFYWFQLQERDKSEPVPPRAVPEFETLVVPLNSTWVSLARERGVFEHDVLPAHLSRTRWYPEHSQARSSRRWSSAVPFCDIGDNRRPGSHSVETHRAQHDRPLRAADADRMGALRPRALQPEGAAPPCARARAKARCSTSPTDQIFIGLFLRNLSRESHGRSKANKAAAANSRPTSRFVRSAGMEPRTRRARSSTSNSTALVDNQYVVKIYRKLERRHQSGDRDGPLLTDVAGFAEYAGSARQRRAGRGRQAQRDRACCTPMIENQGDAWTVTSGLSRSPTSNEQRLLPSGEHPAREPRPGTPICAILA